MKGFIVLFKVEDENVEAFDKLLKENNISKFANVAGVYGAGDYDSYEFTFNHEI